ncbi:MAG: VWA domain-containing protein [Candidatus Eisenbacteria bacterium]|uniref:VWA domain-containing protein n=1 Tax=Eiseniibacteriota bacterium TaxID=2212470 RepID=A0A933WAY6_UNCEI|nr:VWA domain-containing protein [Candidatus Eisenbacteria bacterium]
MSARTDVFVRAQRVMRCAALLAAVAAPAAVRAEPRATPRVARSVVIAMDVSGSMAPHRRAMEEWIVRQTILGARSGDRYRVLTIGRRSFGDELVLPVLDLPATGRLLPDRRALYERLSAWSANARAVLPRVPREDATDVGGAVFQCARLLAGDAERFGERHMVLMTDLRDNRRLALPGDAAALRGVHVMIAFAAHDDGDPVAFARRVETWRRFLTERGAASVRVLDVAECSSGESWWLAQSGPERGRN